MGARCEEVIICRNTKKGKGKNGDPIRIITEVFQKDGTLIALFDPVPENKFSASEMIEFAAWCVNRQLHEEEISYVHVQDWGSDRTF